MTQKEFVKLITEHSDMTAQAAHDAVVAINKAIRYALAHDGNLVLHKVGTLSVVTRKPKVVGKIGTGEPIQIPERKAVKFTPSISLTALVRSKRNASEDVSNDDTDK
jgi:DNA-binding protein HU-beta